MRKNYLWYNFWRYIVVKTGLLLFYKNIKIIGKENIVDKSNILNISEAFTSSNNPLLSTTFLNEGAVSIIPSNVGSLNLSSISNQSSAQFNLYDSQIKGFSNININ